MSKVKICGITNQEDALAAAAYGADFLGFIFYAPSPRYITAEKAKPVIEAVRKQFADLQIVGVFVNETLDHIKQLQTELGLDFVQLHGDEDFAFCEALGLENVIKVLRLKEPLQDEQFFKLSALLLDTPSKQLYGGTGKTFDWAIAKDLKNRYNGQLFLSGGLNPSNVCQALEDVQPYALDLCSGVEASPGFKDQQKLENLFIKVRGHEQTERGSQ